MSQPTPPQSTVSFISLPIPSITAAWTTALAVQVTAITGPHASPPTEVYG